MVGHMNWALWVARIGFASKSFGKPNGISVFFLHIFITLILEITFLYLK